MLNLDVYVGCMPNALLREPAPQRDFQVLVTSIPTPGSYLMRDRLFYRVETVLFRNSDVHGPKLFVSRAYM